MSIRRFNAPTSREALALARAALGADALILSNRSTPSGVEVIATTEDELAQAQQARSTSTTYQDKPAPATKQSKGSSSVERDTEKLAMSTLSFQEYVRERMLRRRQSEIDGTTQAAVAQPARPAQPAVQERQPARPTHSISTIRPQSEAPNIPLRTASTPASDISVAQQLAAMQAMIEERFETMSWLGQAQQNPIQAQLMLKLIRAGYSPNLARTLLERLPQDMPAGQALHWVMQVLQRNLKTEGHSVLYAQQQGFFALVGPTGVGKTTTIAKLATRCALQYGADSVGLITLDTQRMAAHEQLRAHGRQIGVAAHLAHDRAALLDLLQMSASKRMVLIDTAGLSAHDERIQELGALLDVSRVQKLLVLNASSHGDSLDAALTAYKAMGAHNVVLSKVDEAIKLGPALDALIRHQSSVHCISQGQRVPDDLQAANADELVRLSMRTSHKSAHDPKTSELNFYFSAHPNQAPQAPLFA